MEVSMVTRTNGLKGYHSASKTQKITFCGILIAAALVLSYVETLIPLPLPIPGIKLGLANSVSLLALYRLDGKSAFVINICRVLLAGAMFTGFSAMLYGLAGGILSVTVMLLLKKTGLFSIIGVSVAGAAMHIIGQLSVASVIIQSSVIFMSLPLLLISALVSGVLVGWLGWLILEKLTF
jgi:heptaprenyl diphosphate synthase